jgi:hypothetical protein
MRLVDRSMREQHREERRLAEQRATKHRFQARKSCVADAPQLSRCSPIASASCRAIRGWNTQFF